MKRTVSLLLSLVLVFTFVPPAFAASDEAVNAANALYELGLFMGTGTDANGKPNFNLDRTLTRYEGITMLVRLLGKEDEAVSGTWNTPFTDVVDWAKPYIGYAYANSLAAGSTTTTFSGASTMSATQYITLVLRALGYESGTDFQWDRAWELSDKIGLTSGQYNANTVNFTRGDVAIISESALSAKEKGTDNSLLSQLVASGAVTENAADNYLHPVNSIALSQSSVKVTVGKSTTITATVSPSDAADKTVTWSSSNASVASVANGTITGVSVGTATITATTNNGKTATCAVAVDEIGTLSNPLPADGQTTIQYQRWSRYAPQNIKIECVGVLQGTVANALAKSENRFNDTPNDSQEWRFYEFNVTYVSSADGSEMELKASSIIYDNLFYTTAGSQVGVRDIATLGDNFGGHGIFDVTLYPGASGRVIIGILMDKMDGDLLLKVPYDGGNRNTWLLLNPGTAGNLDTTGSGSTSQAPITTTGKNANDLATYISNYGVSSSGFRQIQETRTLNGIKIISTITYRSDVGLLLFRCNYNNGQHSISFDYNIADQTATSPIRVTGVGSTSLLSCSAGFDISSFTENTVLQFAKDDEDYLDTLGPVLGTYASNYNEMSNALVQIAVPAWGILLANTVGMTLHDIGFVSY